MKAYRLYFWFLRTPIDRPGGPWWYRDFTREDERAGFLDALRPCLEEAYTMETVDVDFPLPVHDPMSVIPPRSARRVYRSF